MKRAPKHPALVPGGPWHQLASGKPFALAGQPTSLTIEDVAASLSKICRFAGACTRFYSVAQHSVLVAAIARSKGASAATTMTALLHDAAEMVTGDIPRPIKKMLPGIKAIEADCLARIIMGLGENVSWRLANHDLVKEADEIALATERRLYMMASTVRWGRLPKAVNPAVLGVTSAALSPFDAETLFLAHWQSMQERADA